MVRVLLLAVLLCGCTAAPPGPVAEAPPAPPSWDVAQRYTATTNASADLVFLGLEMVGRGGVLNITATATNQGRTTYSLAGSCASPFDDATLRHPDGTVALPLRSPIRCHGWSCDPFPPGATVTWSFEWDGGPLWGLPLDTNGTHRYVVDVPFEMHGCPTDAPCQGGKVVVRARAEVAVTYPAP